MVICDLCGKTKDCLRKEIDDKEYDICCECWNALAEKLKGKGRFRMRETVILPPPREIKPEEEPEPPGEPPKIWGSNNKPH